MNNPGPMPTAIQTVPPEWCDYNGHLNAGYYTVAFENAFFEVLENLDLGERYVREEKNGLFTLQLNIHYLREVVQGDDLRFTFQLLDYTPKLIHILLQMHHDKDGYLAAVTEQLVLHVSLQSRRAAPMPEAVHQRIAALHEQHRGLPVPEQVGQTMGIRRK